MKNDLHNPRIKFRELEWNWKKHKLPLKFPPYKDLSILQTKITTHQCPTCLGFKTNEIHHVNGNITIKTCQRCKGKGVVKF